MATTKSKSPLDTTLTEANFHHYTVPMRFQKKEIAFVKVDLWNTKFGPDQLSGLGWEAVYNAGKSFCDRTAKIEMDRILPC